MFQQIILPKYNNKLEEELIKLFHSSDLPLHFNKTGNKEFTNYQRVSIIILFHRSRKSIRAFIDEDLSESRWISYLGLKKIPKKSTLHDWLKIFNMKIIRKICKVLLPKEIELTSIDGTGFDSWQRSRHYEKRVGEVHLPHMPYAKTDIFIDVKTQIVLDFSLITHREHDVKGAERIFKRTQINSLRSKKCFMKQREFGWHMIVYNIKRKIKLSSSGEIQSFIFWSVKIFVFPDRAYLGYLLSSIIILNPIAKPIVANIEPI